MVVAVVVAVLLDSGRVIEWRLCSGGWGCVWGVQLCRIDGSDGGGGLYYIGDADGR